ncbi:MAG TPA: branched-chain amino acid ABC transporter permease, partial [Desulfobacteraceae bacterium]|nr:branched-chain amino acid ABC transporter permease [Desulfobacteraceae bacterium]
SRIGIAMRAVSNDQMAALSLGISVNKILIYIWAVAALVAMVGGSLLAGLSILDLNLGFIGLIVFPVIIFGGMDSILGAVLGGFTVGILESLAGAYLEGIVGGGIKGVAPFIIMLIMLMIMPYGLFGTKEVERL